MSVQITNQFWIVGDTNPTTQVWDGPTGAFDANNGANFLTWLNANDGRADQMNGGTVVATANNGAGLIRVQVTGGAFSTGQVFNFVGNNSGAAGAAAITFINSTHFDIQGSVFTVADTAGVIWSATLIDTFVDLQGVINSYNISLLQEGNFYGTPQTFSISGGNVTLTNPLAELTILNNPGGTSIARTVSLPQMNVPGSIPKGVPFYIQINTNDGSGHAPGINLRYADGATAVTAGAAGDVIMLLLSDNSTSNGTVIPIILPFVPVQTVRGGLGTSVAPNDTQIPIGQGGNPKTYAPKTVSGDMTNDDTGVFTLATTGVGAGGPTGDATHVAQITYDAKGRLTTVASVAITGTPPGGSAGGDLSGTYPNPTVIQVENDVAMVGDLLATNIAAPASPAAGKTRIYVDSTSKNIASKNDAGTINHGVQTKAAVTHQFMTAIANDGSSTLAQPASTDLSDLPIPATSGGTGATKYNACRIYRGANQTGIGQTDTKINYDTVDFDPDGIADVSTNHRITPNVAGTFLVSVVAYGVLSAGTPAEFVVSLYRTGVAYATAACAMTTNTNEGTACVTALMQMNGSTDYIEADAQCQSNGTVTVAGIKKLQNLQCVRVGP